jgi:hypothetical protein
MQLMKQSHQWLPQQRQQIYALLFATAWIQKMVSGYIADRFAARSNWHGMRNSPNIKRADCMVDMLRTASTSRMRFPQSRGRRLSRTNARGGLR